MKKFRTVFRRRSLLAGAATMAGMSGCLSFANSDQVEGEPLSDETFNIGVLTSYNHLNSDADEPKGFELAANEIESSGGILGADIELMVREPEDEPENETNFSNLHREYNLDLTFGRPPELNHEEPLWPIPLNETIHISLGPLGTQAAEQLRDDYEDYKYHFRLGMPNGAELADAFMSFVEGVQDEVGWETAALYYDRPVPNGVTEAFKHEVAESLPAKMNLHSVRAFDAIHNFRDYLEELEEDGVDVLLTSAFFNHSYVSQWCVGNWSFDLGGLYYPATYQDFLNGVNGECTNVFTIAPMSPESEHTEHASDFITTYRERYDATPSHDAARAYDALYVFKQAVEEAVERNETDKKPSQEMLIETLVDGSFTGQTMRPTYEFRPREHRYPHEPQWDSMNSDGTPVVVQWQERSATIERATIAPVEHRTASFDPTSE